MKTAKMGFRLKEEDRAQLERIAAIKGLTLSQVIREAIEEYIKEN